MDMTVDSLKKARDEVQAVINGNSRRLSSDAIIWIQRDMAQVTDYTMPLTLAARDYPNFPYALQDAVRTFRNFGMLMDPQTIGGRLFVEKILTIALTRLNGALYALGEQETPYGDELEKARKQLAGMQTKRKIIALSPLAVSVGKSLASIWTKGLIKAQLEAEVRVSDIRTTTGLYFARSAFDELRLAGAIAVSDKGHNRVSITLLPQLKEI
jgi:hypothetical protein